MHTSVEVGSDHQPWCIPSAPACSLCNGSGIRVYIDSSTYIHVAYMYMYHTCTSVHNIAHIHVRTHVHVYMYAICMLH